MTKSLLARKTSLSFCLIASAIFLSHTTSAVAQDQQTGSLADAARQARAQKQAANGATKAQQIANELSEDQNHAAPSQAPAPAPSPVPSKDQATTAPAANGTNSADQNKPADAQPSSNSTASNANGQTGATSTANGNSAQVTAPTTQSAPAPQTPVKPAFKAQPFNYCKSQNNCWDASVLVPADAQLVSSECKQYIFATKVKGSPYMLMAGPAGDACLNSNKSTANQVHWGELATPESALPPGAFNLISSEQTTLDGKQALLIEIGFRKGLTEWMGKRIELENNGVPLVVGCMAPREHFSDGDAVCSAWMESLRLP